MPLSQIFRGRAGLLEFSGRMFKDLPLSSRKSGLKIPEKKGNFMGIYDDPFYYDIAFSFRNFTAEVDTFETLIHRYSKIPVNRILEVACGNAPHLEDLAERGYKYVGLDLNEKMLAHSRKKADRLGMPAQFIQGDMRSFTLDAPVDFAFIALGSLYVKTTQELEQHFASMAKAISPGGLYLIDWCIAAEYSMDMTLRWSIKQDDVKMQCAWRQIVLDPFTQLAEEHIELDIEHDGRRFTITDVLQRRLIFAEEFLLMMKLWKGFEFVGWWSHFDPDEPLAWDDDADVSRVLVAVRRV